MSELIMVADRVLIEPDDGEKKTRTGLLLPASVLESERVQVGMVVRVGPGYVIPNPEYSDTEPWAEPKAPVRYLPLQARIGDEAYFVRKDAIEVTYEEKNYLIVHHQSILALLRPDPSEILRNVGEEPE
ncbi:MAG: co-chaperone GroES [Rhodothermales bacterium]|nr:co-chaperone GroES [Rhodothermales bacterium]